MLFTVFGDRVDRYTLKSDSTCRSLGLCTNDYGSDCAVSELFPRTYNLWIVGHRHPDWAWLSDAGPSPQLGPRLTETPEGLTH